MRNTSFCRIEVHHYLHYIGTFNFGTLSHCYGSAEMKSQWGILGFEEEILTTVSITGASVHSHPATDQLKWSYDEDYLYLKKRYTSQELRYIFTTFWISWNEVTMNINFLWIRYVLVKDCFHYMNSGTVQFHLIVDQLKRSWNEDYLFLKKRGPP